MLACWVVAVTTFAEEEQSRTISDVAILRNKENSSGISGEVELGSIRPSESLRVELDVVNGTKEDLKFDKILGLAGDVRPKRGEIAAGEALRLMFNVEAPANPRQEKNSRLIIFLREGRVLSMVRCDYSISGYVGTASDLITVDLDGLTNAGFVRFSEPIILSDDLREEDFVVSVDAIDCEFTYRTDRDAKMLHGMIKAHGRHDTDRMQGSLSILNLRSNTICKTPLVIHRVSEVSVLPSFLEFMPTANDQGFTSKVFIQPRDVQTHELSQCSVEAKIASLPLTCAVTRLGSGVFQALLRISPEQIERLRTSKTVVSADDSTTPGIVSLSVKYDTMNTRKSVPFSIRGIDELERDPEDRVLVVDAIRTGMMVIESLSPFELYGTSIETRQFNDEPAETVAKMRFRLRYNRLKQHVVFAMERKPDSMKVLLNDDPTMKDSVRYNRIVIEGTSLWGSNTDPASPQVCSSFSHAIAECGIPLPMSWGLTRFPKYESPDRDLGTLTADTGDAGSNLSLIRSNRELRFVLRVNQSPERFDIRQWGYELPHYLPTFAKVERAINGTLVTYFVQTIEWETVIGQQVPARMRSQYTALCHTPEAEVPYLRGDGFQDTDVTWLRVREPAPETKSLVELNTPDDIKRFIDEGAELASRDVE